IGGDKWPTISSSRSKANTNTLYTAFIVSGSEKAITQAKNTTLADIYFLPGLVLSELTIYGSSYRAYSRSSSTTDDSSRSSNAGLIAGLVVGLCGALLIILGLVYGAKAYKNKYERVGARTEFDLVNSNELLGIQSHPNPSSPQNIS
ncbi:unnamed protein product, partial [Rotaria magnacalcarata]